MGSLALARIAAFLAWVLGIGGGYSCVVSIRSQLAGRGIPYLFGFPTFGGGHFEAHGIRTSPALVAGLLVVCVGDAIAGWGLWTGHLWGAYALFALTIPGAVYWWGFDLPYPPLLKLVAFVLIAIGWRSLG